MNNSISYCLVFSNIVKLFIEMNLSKSQLAVLALIIANMIWGAAPPIFKWALADIHPYTLAFLRFAIPCILMYPFIKHKLKVNPKDYIYVFFIGFFGIFINISLFFHGLVQAPSINAALIGSSGPIFIILYSLFFLKEKPNGKLITGTLIGLFGVLIVLIIPLFRHGNLTAVGNFYFLLSMLGSVVSVLLTRRIMKRNNPIAITFWSFFVGAICFTPLFVGEIGQYGLLTNLNVQGILGLFFGIFFSSLIAYFLQTWALKYLTAANVSIFTYIDPIITILIAAPLLSEFPDTTFVAGSFFVLLGILLAEGRIHYHPFHLFFKP